MRIKRTIIALCAISASVFCNGQTDLRWINPLKEGAEVHGQGWPELRHTYNRLPQKAKALVNRSVWRLGQNSAGLSIVFRSDAPDIKVRYQVRERRAMYHMPSTGVSGIDLYATDSKGVRHFVSPPHAADFADTISYTFRNIVDPVSGKAGVTMTYRLSLPLYNTVEWLEIGVPEGRSVEFLPVTDNKPIVVYGTSITQGGCCSRPSMAWPSIVGANLGREVVNLGFSGEGKAEAEYFDLISEIDASLVFFDCIANTNSSKPIGERIEYGVRKIRETSDCPILLAEYSICGQVGAIDPWKTADVKERNEILRQTYLRLKKDGVRNLFYMKADEWSAGMDGYVDGEHPNDWGMMNLAKGVTKKLKTILK